jgi:hypothetical protein
MNCRGVQLNCPGVQQLHLFALLTTAGENVKNFVMDFLAGYRASGGQFAPDLV